MNYELVEDQITNHLIEDAELTALADVKPLPEAVDDYGTPTIKGLVTVAFMGEKFQKNQSLGQSSQHSNVSFVISVQSRKLRGEKGVYVISELIKNRLIGFAPSDCGILTIDSHEFANYQNDVWEHNLIFTASSLRTKIDYDPIPADIIIEEEVYFKNQTTDENIHV